MSEEIGTLAKLNLQPGDVVEYVSGSDHDADYSGVQWTVADEPLRGRVARYRKGEETGFLYAKRDTWIFRIVSRAKSDPGPVRMVTRKEIVPGMYGRVEVTDSLHVRVNAVNTATELRAAIATLTQIADALEESK